MGRTKSVPTVTGPSLIPLRGDGRPVVCPISNEFKAEWDHALSRIQKHCEDMLRMYTTALENRSRDVTLLYMRDYFRDAVSVISDLREWGKRRDTR